METELTYFISNTTPRFPNYSRIPIVRSYSSDSSQRGPNSTLLHGGFEAKDVSSRYLEFPGGGSEKFVSNASLASALNFPPMSPNKLLDVEPSPLLTIAPSHLPNDTKGNNEGAPVPEDALLNRSSVIFVAVSFILLMLISLAWLIFYYVQRFRYLHSKERASRRLAELARKAVARIPLKVLRTGDEEMGINCEHCAICIESYRQFDNIRILPCRHYFHKICIDPWLLEQRSCPICKMDIIQAYGLRPYTNNLGLDDPSVAPSVISGASNPESGVTFVNAANNSPRFPDNFLPLTRVRSLCSSQNNSLFLCNRPPLTVTTVNPRRRYSIDTVPYIASAVTEIQTSPSRVFPNREVCQEMQNPRFEKSERNFSASVLHAKGAMPIPSSFATVQFACDKDCTDQQVPARSVCDQPAVDANSPLYGGDVTSMAATRSNKNSFSHYHFIHNLFRRSNTKRRHHRYHLPDQLVSVFPSQPIPVLVDASREPQVMTNSPSSSSLANEQVVVVLVEHLPSNKSTTE